MSEIGILCNPRGGRARRRLEQIRRMGAGVREGMYREATTLPQISEALGGLLEGGCDRLCLIGGDGTLQAALTALLSLRPPEDWPVLAPLPGGTTNMTHKDLGAWASVEDGLKALSNWKDGQNGTDGPNSRIRMVKKAVLRIDHGGSEPVGGMFFGAGAVAAGIRYWHERFDRKDLPGNHAVRMTIAHLLGSLAFSRGGAPELVQPLSCAVNGSPGTPHRALLCLATSLDTLLLGLRPYWGGEPGSLHVSLVEEGARGLWWRLHRVGMGRPGKALVPEAGYLSRNAEIVELTFDGPFVVDGELFEARAEAGPVRISAAPGVRWMVPAGK